MIRIHSSTRNASTWNVARTACQRAKRSSFAFKSASSSGASLRLSITGAALVVAKVCRMLKTEARESRSNTAWIHFDALSMCASLAVFGAKRERDTTRNGSAMSVGSTQNVSVGSSFKPGIR